MRRDVFSEYHPLVEFLYFTLVLLCAMVLMHPVCLGISLLCALWYDVELHGGRAVGGALRWLLPMMLLAAVLNPAFNHAGVTILLYLPSGNSLTLESILYGLAAAVLLAAVVIWFRCCAAVLTADKFVYLFGRILPALSLVLSMALRFLPKCAAQLRTIRMAQRCVGRDLSQGSAVQRMRNGIKMLSILVTWSLETAIETADSMKSRGYGLPGRTAFSIYRFDRRDRLALLWLLLCGGVILAGGLGGAFSWRYFPTLGGPELTGGSLACQVCLAALGLTPVYLNGREGRKWKRLRSGI